MSDNGNDTCARKTLGPWLAAVGVLIVATIVLAFYYADDIRRAQRNRGPISLVPGWRGGARPPAADVKAASFIPPWHGRQNPDSVTGATPKIISFNRAIGIVSPSVASIKTSGAAEQTASGIIVHHLGYILTNYHVVRGARNIVVTLSYDQLIKSYPAELVDSRPDLDLAVIKVTSTSKGTFTPAPLGNSNKVFIGQQVVAIGNPFGLSQSASAGIISNTDRTLTAGDKVIKGLIQTDASINPGSSGGALVNPRGEVIGINTAIYSPTQSFSGIGFAVPVNQAKAAFGDLIEIVPSPAAGVNTQRAGGNTNRFNVPALANLRMMARTTASTPRPCWLGIAVRGVDDVVAREFDLPIHYGVLVNRIFPNSPAAAAGIRRGDVIFRVDHRRVRNDKMLWSFLDGRQAGETAELAFFRNNSKKTLVCTLRPEPPNVRSLLPGAPQGTPALQTVALATAAPTGTLPSPREQNAAGKNFIEGHWLGLEVIPLTAELATEYQIPKGETGVLVDEITLEAAESGILAGDMVQSISGSPTPDLKAFFEATQRERVQEEKQAQVQVSRRGSRMTFIMTARNANMLGFAQMEAAQPIQPGALRPHRYRGRACTNCHIFMQTGGQLPTDAGDILPTPPVITKNAKAPHRYRGRCVTCHTIR